MSYARDSCTIVLTGVSSEIYDDALCSYSFACHIVYSQYPTNLPDKYISWVFQGMVDAGENLSVTLKREFGEEALNTLEVSESQRDLIKDQIDKIFTKGIEVSNKYSLTRAAIFLNTT